MSTEAHVRLTAEGTLGSGSGNEIWSCSLKIQLQNGIPDTGLLEPTQSDLNELAAGGAALWGAFITGSGAGGFSDFSNNVVLKTVKATGVRPSDGKNDPATNPAVVAPVGEHRGGSAVPNVIYQNAIAVTFRGDQYIRGSGALGRMFLPGPNFSASDGGIAPVIHDGLMDPATVLRFATATAALLTALNSPNIVLSSSRTHLVSNIGKSSDRAGLRHQPVTKVTVDSRPDSVRSRHSAISGRGIQSHAV